MDIYRGKGTEGRVSFDDYMDFINYVFGFSGESKDFKKLLPKLYRPELSPEASNYIVTEDGKLRAAVGAYDHEIIVCEKKLKCRGIGNVAVHPYHRSKGYMKDCMFAALDDMIKDGVVMSTLGGRRQRYNYFSYDKCGSLYSVSINNDNIRHTFGKPGERTHRFVLKEITSPDDTALDNIAELINEQQYIPVRPRNELFNIMKSWHTRIFAGFESDRFIGYCTYLNETVREIQLVDNTDITDFIVCLYDETGSDHLSVALPEFRTDYIDALYRLGEGVSIGYNMSYTILNYKAVIEAFFKLKETYKKLPAGRLTVLIHGYAGDEKLCLSVCNGIPSVDEYDGESQFELSHTDAMAFLFGFICPERNGLSAEAAAWLPLPLWMYHVDEV